ncbi:MAG: hypothetical protein HFF03_00800 [Oscillospiraceae bacterium]|jgi:hypothetical protein|nr:hypothetical protein [Oscillospiraceae bacterium]
MHWMDYQKKLGLGFDDNRKGLRFVAQMHNYFANSTDIEFSRGVEITFCNIIGMPTKPEEDPYRLFGDELYGLQRAWLYLEERQAYFSDFLSCCVALINSYPKKEKAVKNALKRELFDALSNSQIKYNILTDKDGIFVFPKGAEELDDALVSQPLEWLKQYPESEKAWVKALKSYADATEANASDVADLFRKTLETFFREFFKGNKSLENYKKDYGDYLKGKGIPTEISNNLETLLQAYTNFINNYAKHRDATSDKVLEYLMYQTGNIIRLLITLEGQP